MDTTADAYLYAGVRIMNWGDVPTWIQAATTIVLAGITLKYVLATSRILTETTKNRNAEVFLEVSRILLASAPRRWAVAKFPRDISAWDQEAHRDVANRLSLDLERVAFICEKGLIDPELVMAGHALVFVSAWRDLSAFVTDLRSKTGQPQREHLESFAAKCRDYLRRQGRSTP